MIGKNSVWRWSVPEVEAMGRQLIVQLRAELKAEAAKFGRQPAREILEAAARGWTPGSDTCSASMRG